MPDFTRGPWMVSFNDEDTFNGVPIIGAGRDMSWVPVANVPVDYDDRIEREANAQLIGAAPSMYAALKVARKEIIDALEEYGDDDPEGYEPIKIIDAALAEAEGK